MKTKILLHLCLSFLAVCVGFYFIAQTVKTVIEINQKTYTIKRTYPDFERRIL
jgi:hypothetical protein